MEPMVKLTCPTCGGDIASQDINIERMVAKCAQCSTVFSFAHQFDGSARAAGLSEIPVQRPTSITVENTGGELVFSRRWWGVQFIVLAIFASMWCGFLIIWFGIAIFTRVYFMAAFGSLHALIGLFLVYYVLTGFFNRTTVRVGANEIAVTHGPLPWGGNKRIETPLVVQLYTKEVISRGRRRTNLSYSLHAITRDGRDERLLGGLDTADTSIYIEQEIERYLNIRNQPVRGEYR